MVDIDAMDVPDKVGVRRGLVSTRLGHLHYIATDDRQGTPLLLLPQAGRSCRMYAGLWERLRRQHTIYTIDYPGSGASDPLPAGTRIEDIAGAIVDFLDALGVPKVDVYGLHAGNKIGTALAANWPDRVNKCILAGQSHSIVPSNEKRLGTVGAKRTKLLKAADARETSLVRWADLFNAVSHMWWREDLMRDIANEDLRRDALEKVVDELQATEGIPEFYRANRAYDLEGDLARIQAPTLVIEITTPEESERIGPQGDALKAVIPDCEVVVIERDGGHGITLEDDYGQLARLLERFLRT